MNDDFYFGYSIAKSSVVSNDRVVLNSLLKFFEEDGKAFSLLRLGDGEAKILGWPKYVSRETLDAQLKIWFGKTDFNDHELFKIRDDLVKAINNADVIGLPTKSRLINNRGKLDQHVCSILYYALFEGDEFHLTDKLFCSASVHTFFHSSKIVLEYIKNYDYFYFVGKDAKAASELLGPFDKKYSFLSIPPEKWGVGVSDHYPVRYNEIVCQIEESCTKLPNSIAFVGAGVLGKVYCDFFKGKGIPAMDIGSLIDIWSGSIPEQRSGLVKNKKLTLEYLFND